MVAAFGGYVASEKAIDAANEQRLTKPVTVPRLYRTLLHWLDVGQGYELPRPRQVL